jgi:EmrB/QacA subfamily drug resistance transporter
MSSQRSNRALVIVAVMASMAMIAIEATIVATAMPQIAAQLGDLNLYTWVFSSFLLAQTTMTVVFGKLSDIYGRKPVLMVGIAIFLIGSVLAGFSQSMPEMIAFRLLQGIGAGAIQPVAMTVVADLYPGRERGKIQGYLASVWAISAVAGPLIGSVIVHNLSWAWIFWINIPVGIIAAGFFLVFLNEDFQRRNEKIDVIGALLFAIAMAALMVGMTDLEGATIAHTVIAAAIFLVSVILFLRQESRASHPMMSITLWRMRPIATSNMVTLLSSIAMMGLTTFLPIYVQIVLNRSALVAGLALTMLLLGWPCAATLAARNFHRVGVRPLMIAGTLFALAGASFFVFLVPESSPVMPGIGSLVMGFGMGLMSIPALVLIQNSVEWQQRGSATASNVFSRNLGSTLGATIFGAVLNYCLAHSMSNGTFNANQLRALLNGTGATSAVETPLRMALQDSLHITFTAMAAFAVLTVIASLFIPAVNVEGAAPVREMPGH